MTPRLAADLRKSELATIHMAKKALNLTDEEYRDVMFTVTRCRSAADLDWTGRKKLIEHFERCGFKKWEKPRSKTPKASDKVDGKALSLWLQLRDAGALRDASDAAFRAFCLRTVKVERLEWMSAAQSKLLIESLKSWLARIKASKGAKSDE